MLIDCHTHIYPDSMAPQTIEHLINKGGVTSYGKATVEDYLEKMAQWQVDAIIAAHIATNPKQQVKVNDFAIAVNKEPIYSFGSVYPGDQDALSHLERIKDAGLKGIKLHPEYQNFRINDEKAYPIYEKCGELGLIILFHAGRDPGFVDSYQAKPAYILEIAQEFPRTTFIAAHMGGFNAWDEVEESLCGVENVYFDTSFISHAMDPRQTLRLIRKHGAEKILFGTDMPWTTPFMIKDFLESAGITEEEKELIWYKNATALLDIQL